MKNYDITLRRLHDIPKWFTACRIKRNFVMTTERWDDKKGKAYVALFEVFLFNYHFAIWKWQKPKEWISSNTECRLAFSGPNADYVSGIDPYIEDKDLDKFMKENNLDNKLKTFVNGKEMKVFDFDKNGNPIYTELPDYVIHTRNMTIEAAKEMYGLTDKQIKSFEGWKII